MAVHKAGGGGSPLPENAVRLTEEEALKLQWEVMENWEPQSDVWALKHSSSILGGAAAITSIYLNEYYRRKVRLGNYARIATYLPAVVAPAFMTVALHSELITKDILISKTPCGACVQLRAAALQVATSTIYPSLLAPVASFTYASRYFTSPIPSLLNEPCELFRTWRTMTKPILSKLGTIMILETLFAMTLVYLQSNAVINMSLQQEKLERALRQFEGLD